MTNNVVTPKKKFSVPSSKQDELLNVQVAYFIHLEELKLSKKERLKRMIWDPRTKSFFGRNGSQWSKLGLFYLIFYGILAAMFAVCMWVFLQTLNSRMPKWKLESSIIGTNPGLGFRPKTTDKNPDSSLIWFQGSNRTNLMKWVDKLKHLTDKYYAPGKVEKTTVKRCNYNQTPHENEVCDFDVSSWRPCVQENYFEYHRNAPCIFLKLNKIYGWVPEYYNDTKYLPTKMPKQLINHIRYNVSKEQLNTIWVSCEGEQPSDIEHLGPIAYHPSIQGFPGYYYPFQNTEGYLSPLVAVQFLRPAIGVIINIECKAWARNIKHKRTDQVGSVHFELLIDSKDVKKN